MHLNKKIALITICMLLVSFLISYFLIRPSFQKVAEIKKLETDLIHLKEIKIIEDSKFKKIENDIYEIEKSNENLKIANEELNKLKKEVVDLKSSITSLEKEIRSLETNIKNQTSLNSQA